MPVSPESAVSKTGVHQIDVTPEMLKAGERVLQSFDREADNPFDTTFRFLEAILAAADRHHGTRKYALRVLDADSLGAWTQTLSRPDESQRQLRRVVLVYP